MTPMPTSLRPVRRAWRAAPVLRFLVASACVAVTLAAASSRAAEPETTAADVEDARRCAAATRTAGHAFAEVRDSVQAGGSTRAQALLAESEDALRDAKAACVGNDEVSRQLDLLDGEAQGLRRSLAGSGR
jgi:hypothetical protein